MIRFSLKLALVAGATYFTVEQGVWKDSERTIEIYDNIVQSVTPYVQQVGEQVPVKIPEIPTPTKFFSSIPDYWNKGVNKSCIFLWHLPELVSENVKKGYDMLVTSQEVKNMMYTLSVNEQTADTNSQQSN